LAATGSADNTFGTVRTAPEGLLYLNPAVAMIEIVANTEIQPGDYSKIMSEIRGTGSGIPCDGDACVPTDGPSGVAPPALKVGPALECPANAGCAAAGPALAIFDPQPLSGHFWPRYAISMGILALLLTLASMRLVAPTGGRFSLRRRPAAAPIPVTNSDPQAPQ
jgi:hypothetical protein